jgi:hypothetical protein
VPAIERCLLASTWIRLASMAKRSPPTRPAARHASTTLSNTRRKTSPFAETLVAGARERRMVRDDIFDTELAEPAIGEVHLHLSANQPLRPDRKDIPHDQHPDHQFRIDRRGDPSMNNEVQVRCEDRTDRVSAKTKLVENLTLVTLRTAHHRPRRDSHQHNGIMLRGLSQPIFATKAAPSRHASGC